MSFGWHAAISKAGVDLDLDKPGTKMEDADCQEKLELQRDLEKEEEAKKPERRILTPFYESSFPHHLSVYSQYRAFLKSINVMPPSSQENAQVIHLRRDFPFPTRHRLSIIRSHAVPLPLT